MNRGLLKKYNQTEKLKEVEKIREVITVKRYWNV